MKTIRIKIPKVKTRVTWGFNPVTRVSQDKKGYSRASYKKVLREKNLSEDTK